jgi:BolA-like protein 1
VPGCLSVVHVHATQQEDGTIIYQGDSDSQLTKGIVCLLVKGLSGNTPESIEQVKPEFIQFAGIGATLTPGRNNGFLNMMMKMKAQARQFSSSATSSVGTTDSADGVRGGGGGGGKIYDRIVSKLTMLKPSELVVEDESHKHAGHAGMNGSDAVESHFNVRIIADCFEGLGLVQRHKMIYTLLDAEMKESIHALSIYSKTPVEERGE